MKVILWSIVPILIFEFSDIYTEMDYFSLVAQ